MYNRLYDTCQNRESDFSSPCDTVYAMLASLYYEKGVGLSNEYGEYFKKKYPTIDSAAIMEDFTTRIPEFDTSVNIFNELISHYGTDRLDEELFLRYITSLFYSGKLGRVKEAAAQFKEKYSNGYYHFQIDYMDAGTAMRSGNYDRAENTIEILKERYQGTSFSKQQEALEYLGKMLYFYRKLGLKEE